MAKQKLVCRIVTSDRYFGEMEAEEMKINMSFCGENLRVKWKWEFSC